MASISLAGLSPQEGPGSKVSFRPLDARVLTHRTRETAATILVNSLTSFTEAVTPKPWTSH